jgi:outer membrane protein assembly factor BamE (lipoprotein component of BamABCDE complex)
MCRTTLCLLLATALLAVTGCITVGRDFYSADLHWLKSGTTTRQEVYRILGEPFRTGVDQGKITWTYGCYRYSAFGDTRTKDLVIYYNPDGTVHTYTFSTSFPDEKTTWRDRAAP